ncbi:hypothetical protein SPHINGO391_470058 [Sphingomonas aurantiaca]|uniref:Uncharacterized protein n=1 Tax=Sphingomonas aurantiaca TaxID=185949 RepID=A0A5E7ZNK2_9SPHN|nr:hypothetical protein [Sphingomonas aurantiaca]VVT20357.1 hypothetical protein SPHINGO391_470058 [Sphingomonas aurantiaca]
MVKLRATATMQGAYGIVRRGDQFEASPAQAADLLKRKRATRAPEPKPKKAAKSEAKS